MGEDTMRTTNPGFGRRALMRMGAGVVVASAAARGSAQRPERAPEPGSPRPAGPRPHTGPGYRYTANRLGSNGPMDDTSRKIVQFVHGFNDSNMTGPIVQAVNRTMVDSMAAMIAGFESEPVRIAARLARLSPAGSLKSTVLGYGVATTPELAAFGNGCMIRHTDFNDNAPGGHNSDLIPAALAIGEALHSTGLQVMAAVTIGYELKSVPAGGESAAAAMVAAKLMNLDEDRLANALTLALTPHVALNKGVGAMSMWKGCRTAEATKCGVWAALMAREGMTGPPQPFEGRGGLWDSQRRAGREFSLPAGRVMSIEQTWAKKYPSDAQTQGAVELIPEIKKWTTVDDIGSIEYDMTLDNWEEVGDAPKWDPRNRETGDHSVPYVFCRAMLDGDIYLDSFTEAKLSDPAVHALMDKMTLAPVDGWEGLGTARITIIKKNGNRRSFDTWGGVRNPQLADYRKLMSDADIEKKFSRACAYMQIDNAQRDRIHAAWSNLQTVKDIGDAIATLASFGRPRSL